MKGNRQRAFALLATILALALCLVPWQPVAVQAEASGTTYYISDSDGSDENDGQSEATPWKTIDRLTTVQLSAGDQVLLKAGDIWYGSWELDVSGGSKDNPIQISSYGEGEKPSLRFYQGSVAQGGTGICLTLKNANGLEVRNLRIGFANQGVRLAYDPDHYGSEYVRFEDCHFHDIYGVTQLDGLEEIYVSSGIDTQLINTTAEQRENFGDNWPLNGLYINRCTAYDAGSLVCGPVGVKGFYMTECVAEKNGYYGTTVFGCEDGYIERCVFDGNGTRDMPAGSCGIMLGTVNFTVRNSIIANQQRQGDDPDGCGIDFEWKNQNVTIDNCLFQGNAGVGLMFFTSGQGEEGTNYDSKVTNCLFVDNNTNIGNLGGYEIFSTSYGGARCEVSNNRYLTTEGSESETVAFSLYLDNNDILEENNQELEALPDNLPAAIFNPVDSQGLSGQGEGAMPWYYWLTAALAALLLTAAGWGIGAGISHARRKKASPVAADEKPADKEETDHE